MHIPEGARAFLGVALQLFFALLRRRRALARLTHDAHDVRDRSGRVRQGELRDRALLPAAIGDREVVLCGDRQLLPDDLAFGGLVGACQRFPEDLGLGASEQQRQTLASWSPVGKALGT